MTATWRLPDNSQTTACRLPANRNQPELSFKHILVLKVNNDLTISQSTPILRFLVDSHPETNENFYPKSLEKRAWVNEFMGFFHSSMNDLSFKLTACRLQDGCLMIAWQLPDNCLKNAWRLLDDGLLTVWQLPDECLTTAWWLPEDCLTTAWCLPRLADDDLMTACRLT